MSNGPKLFTEEDAAVIRNLIDIGFQTTYIDQNPEIYLDTCTDDVIHIPPGQPVSAGIDASRSLMENPPKWTSYSLAIDEVTGNGDLAYSFYTVTFNVDHAGENSARVIGIFRRDSDGSWKVSRYIWNSEIPLTP